MSLNVANTHWQAAQIAEVAGDTRSAQLHCIEALKVIPDHPQANLRMAKYARALKNSPKAVMHLERAFGGASRYDISDLLPVIYVERSELAGEQGLHDYALSVARAGLARCGEIPALIRQEVAALRALGKLNEYALRLNRLAALEPSNVEVLLQLAWALLETPSAAQAAKPFYAALSTGLVDDDATLALAMLERKAKNWTAAESLLDGALRRKPTHLGLLGERWYTLKEQCRWHDADAAEQALCSVIAAGSTDVNLPPFALLLSELPQQQLKEYTRRYGAQFSSDMRVVQRNVLAKKARLRVGYLSADFHQHATSMLIAGLFEAHDRDRIECFVYSYGPRTSDAYRERLKLANFAWRDLNDMSDDEAAHVVRTDEIDILIDLKGLTNAARVGIVTRKPAPVIIHYLGYPGTVGIPGIDYIVADAIVVPPEHEQLYLERVLRLPECYQANDAWRAHPAPSPRLQLGLAEDALVLCNFNASTKWNRNFMQIWLASLQLNSRAVLWMLDSNASAREAINAMALELGVMSQILWAPHADIESHLGRLASANLALDQLPYSSHTTGADALWMGVPLLTCIGDAFQGRVGASLVYAANLQNFVTHSIAEYETRLRRLIVDPTEIFAAQLMLREKRTALPLFDTASFAANWETLLLSVHEAQS